MKKLTVILIILFIGILLAGCTSQTTTEATPTPTPTAEVTAVPTAESTAAPTEVATTEVPTEEPTTEAPTTEPTPIPDVNVKVMNTLTFDPPTLNIPAGTKVIFSTDAVGYKFKIALSGLGFNAVSDIISPGTSWSYTFTKPGTYTMEEQIYPQFHDDNAKIVVT